MPQTLIKPNPLTTLFNELTAFSKETWCQYLFDRDLLVNKVTPEQRTIIIAGASQCGEEMATAVTAEYGPMTAPTLAEKVCTVEHGDSQNISEQVFLATFTEPNMIKVYDEPMRKLARLSLPGFNEKMIEKIVMGHELYHYLEGQDPTLFTRRTKIGLWHFLGYEHRTTVRAASEIAAMTFSWQLNKLPYSPLVLDVLLLQCYNEKAVAPVLEELRAVNV
ncbi:MAG: hypothetical protein LKI92_00310 [Schleiferilactobacillus harbinensis]|nr:hypothetical protein [Schleiferilactobacillus harbinensis]MCI1912224.1 hypothetical protein [Schleiferilactobacillus harbinensis]